LAVADRVRPHLEVSIAIEGFERLVHGLRLPYRSHPLRVPIGRYGSLVVGALPTS
jgi:hypothetical protein